MVNGVTGLGYGIAGLGYWDLTLKENSVSRQFSNADFNKVLPPNYVKMIIFHWRQISIVILLEAAWNGYQLHYFWDRN